MSLREKGLIVGCLLLFGGIVVARGLVFPVYAQHKKNLGLIRQRVSTIELYEAIRKDSGLVESKLGRMKEQATRMEAGLLEGGSAPEAGILLQGILKPLIRKPTIRMMGIRTLAPVKKGAYTEISVQFDLQADTAELAQIMAEVARQPKFLKVRKLHANTGMFPGRPMDGKETIVISMVVAGLSGAPVDEVIASEGGNP